MSSILKETENSAVTASPTATAVIPGAPVAKSGTEEPARPQPVALEIPVTVNGARTVEGSDKREPFSETTKTVLVFGHGAVVRVSSALTPGQLIFLTNEKTKKEVVCQVVKSKNQGAANGYVELQFTEPAPGYWGMRFPAGNSAPAVSVVSRPAVPPSAKPAAPPPAVIAPAAPAVVPAAPVSVVPTAVTPVAPPTVVVPIEQKIEMRGEAPRPVEPTPVIEAAKVAETPRAVPVEKTALAKTEAAGTTSEEKIAAPEVVASVPKIAIVENPSLDDLAKQLTKELLQGALKQSAKEAVQLDTNESEARKIEPEVLNETVAKTSASVPEPVATVVPARAPADTSSEELKQKAARLQQQLGSLLFADSKQQPTTSVSNEAASLSDASQKVVEIAKIDIAAAPQIVSSKPSPLLQKPLGESIEVEEVKIPSWLAPLARESDFRTVEATTAGSTTADAGENSAANKEATEVSAGSEDAPHIRQQSAMFGGQLITDSPASGEAPRGSKKGLWIGIAASALLLAGGGAWYAKQPDSLLAGIFSSKPAPTVTAARTTSDETPFRNEVSKPAEPGRAASTGTNTASGNSNIATPIPNTSSTNSAAAVSFPSAKNSVASLSSAAPKAEPPAEQPRKPVFGDVHLTTPSIKRADGSTDSNSAEPTIENNSSEAGAAALNTLAAGHSGGPAIPLPVGGEVKQAKMLKAVPPVYPPSARAQHVSGDVKLDALIDTHGKVTATKVLSGPGLLHQAATEAVKQWQYEPAQLNGQTTSMHLTVTVQFRLQ